jgi:hypothetical protein
MDLSALPARIEIPINQRHVRRLGFSLIDAGILTHVSGSAEETLRETLNQLTGNHATPLCTPTWSVTDNGTHLTFEIYVDQTHDIYLRSLYIEMENHTPKWGQTLLRQLETLLPYCFSPSRLLGEIEMNYWMAADISIDSSDEEFQKLLTEFYDCDADIENSIKPSEVRQFYSSDLLHPQTLTPSELSNINPPSDLKPLQTLLLKAHLLPPLDPHQTAETITDEACGPIAPIAILRFDTALTDRVLDDLFAHGNEWEPYIFRAKAPITEPERLKRISKQLTTQLEYISLANEILQQIQNR